MGERVTKLTEQQERFCRLIVEGKSQREAYLGAGYNPSNDNATDAAASRLLSSVKVQTRLTELRAPATRRMQITLESITEMLREDRELARQNNQASAAVSASMGIAKLHGFAPDKVEIEDKTVYAVSNRPKTDEAWATEFTPAPRPN